MKKALSHIDKNNDPVMVDVSQKPDLLRAARAAGMIRLQPATLRLIAQSKVKKGNVLVTARLAAIMAAKRTAEMIPLCHNIGLTDVKVDCRVVRGGVMAESQIRCIGKTGAEMEALHAVAVALLTVYDMCKAADKKMVIENIRLIEKTKEKK